VISRLFVIGLAFVAAALRASQRAWIEAAGLSSLGAGLLVLRFAAGRPALKPIAYAAFAVTAVTLGIALMRQL
jgi:hypothetical protein